MEPHDNVEDGEIEESPSSTPAFNRKGSDMDRYVSSAMMFSEQTNADSPANGKCQYISDSSHSYSRGNPSDAPQKSWGYHDYSQGQNSVSVPRSQDDFNSSTRPYNHYGNVDSKHTHPHHMLPGASFSSDGMMAPQQMYGVPPFGPPTIRGHGRSGGRKHNYHQDPPRYQSSSYFGRSGPPLPPGAPPPLTSAGFQPGLPPPCGPSRGYPPRPSSAAMTGRRSPQDVDMEVVDSHDTHPSGPSYAPLPSANSSLHTMPPKRPQNTSPLLLSDISTIGGLVTNSWKNNQQSKPRSSSVISNSDTNKESRTPKSKPLIHVVSDPNLSRKESIPSLGAQKSTPSYVHSTPVVPTHTIRTRPSGVTRTPSVPLPLDDPSTPSITDLIDTIHSGSRDSLAVGGEDVEEVSKSEARTTSSSAHPRDEMENIGAAPRISESISESSGAGCAPSIRRARLGWGQGLRRRTSGNMDTPDAPTGEENETVVMRRSHSIDEGELPGSDVMDLMPSNNVPIRRTQSEIVSSKSSLTALLSPTSKANEEKKTISAVREPQPQGSEEVDEVKVGYTKHLVDSGKADNVKDNNTKKAPHAREIDNFEADRTKKALDSRKVDEVKADNTKKAHDSRIVDEVRSDRTKKAHDSRKVGEVKAYHTKKTEEPQNTEDTLDDNNVKGVNIDGFEISSASINHECVGGVDKDMDSAFTSKLPDKGSSGNNDSSESISGSPVKKPPLLDTEALRRVEVETGSATAQPRPSPSGTPRVKGRPGRPPLSDEAKAVKKAERRAKKKAEAENDLLISGSRRKAPSVSESGFDSNSDGEDGKPKGKRLKKMGSVHAGDSDGDSGGDESAPKKRRGRPPAGNVKASEGAVMATATQGPKLSRTGRKKATSSDQVQTVPSMPVKRRSRSFGSFERDSLGSLFSSDPDLSYAFFALQGMVRIQMRMRGVGGFCTEDLQHLHNLLQSVQSVVNLPIPYTSEIMMCLDIIEAKTQNLGDALSKWLIWRKELEESAARGEKKSVKPRVLSKHSSQPQRSIQAPSSGLTQGGTVGSAMPSLNSSPIALVKKTVGKADRMHVFSGQISKSESLAPMFAKENCKRAAIANICSQDFISAFASPGDCLYPINQTRVQSLQEDMQRKRSVIAAEVRRRKLARTQAWEVLGDRYLRVKHQWEHYVEHNRPPEQEEDEKYTARLRELAAMRNIMSPRTPARLSAMRASASAGNDITRPEYDQDKVLQQLAMMELMQRRLKTGVTKPTDMLSPWQHADHTVAPEPPRWPPRGLLIPDYDPMGSITESQDDLDLFKVESFPKHVVEPPVIVDLNGCRLTTDGRRQMCSALAPSQECVPGCNCALQVDRVERQCRPWTDMEKCIFVDKFLQFPKNFSKIASYLTNRTTKDCIKFYYDSKTTIPYKSLLREFDNRKRHVKNSWSHTSAAAHSVGGVVYPPDEFEDKEQLYELPVDDVTYGSLCSHPLYMAAALGFEEKKQEDMGTTRRQHMKYMQQKEPRAVTRLLADRRYLRKTNAQAGGGQKAGMVSRKFAYSCDQFNEAPSEDMYGGYAQSDAGWLQCQSELRNSRSKRARDPNNSMEIIEGPRERKESAVAAAAAPTSPGRGRGRGRRGRRTTVSSRGGGRTGGRAEDSIPVAAKPTNRGRG
eukprot:CAMPEP_0185042584 /NCGR_PEP_ID=MMETSP1103-20130426/42436_1 /TAXON_ID=36769 /ORGANISM="Paraphysomonas bandaiensis, Strain Caron Lab Isolate" /LENGTH=1641 /DNA_ID=CAMNT_0027582679 /DNA_START=91 /DNA_END=5013 /DNA_ORIENTATION=+